jgi:hypothetical protein
MVSFSLIVFTFALIARSCSRADCFGFSSIATWMLGLMFIGKAPVIGFGFGFLVVALVSKSLTHVS